MCTLSTSLIITKNKEKGKDKKRGKRNPFTTPSTTRKRKAAEAANNEATSTPTTSEISVGAAAIESPPVAVAVDSPVSASTSSGGKVRKLDPYSTDSGRSTTGPATDHKLKGVVEVDLATPATTSMESDDDFMSDASSPDFLDTQGSDVESIDGALPSPSPPSPGWW